MALCDLFRQSGIIVLVDLPLPHTSQALPLDVVALQVVDQDSVSAGDNVTIQVELEREYDADGEIPPVCAPHYPVRKDESWWLVVGNPKKGTLAAIKRVTLQRKARVKIDLTAPSDVGKHEFKLFFMCDSYMGCDQEYELPLQVAEAKDADDDEDEDDEDA